MKELFIRFTASAFRKLLSIYVFSYFPFGFEGRMWYPIVSVPDHCLSFYLLNIDNIYFEQVVNRIYPAELQLNKTNSSDTEAPFLDLNLSISNGTVSTKIYDKQDDFDIANFPFSDGDVPRRTSYGVYISQLIKFARASSNVSDFNCRNKALTAKLFKQGYRYHKLRKFSF